MGKKNTNQTVKNLIGDTVTNLGFELWNVEYYNDAGEWLLEITIDKPGGVSIDDCETVTRAIDPIIDDADPIENSYSLVVSSPGLNRELKTDLHINRYIDKTVAVRLFAKNENLSALSVNTNGKNFIGLLKENAENTMTFEVFATPDKTLNKHKNTKNNIIDIKNDNNDDTDINNIITLAKKDIAHISAYDEIDI